MKNQQKIREIYKHIEFTGTLEISYRVNCNQSRRGSLNASHCGPRMNSVSKRDIFSRASGNAVRKKREKSGKLVESKRRLRTSRSSKAVPRNFQRAPCTCLHFLEFLSVRNERRKCSSNFAAFGFCTPRIFIYFSCTCRGKCRQTPLRECR